MKVPPRRRPPGPSADTRCKVKANFPFMTVNYPRSRKRVTATATKNKTADQKRMEAFGADCVNMEKLLAMVRGIQDSPLDSSLDSTIKRLKEVSAKGK